jgi:hypothetical protein
MRHRPNQFSAPCAVNPKDRVRLDASIGCVSVTINTEAGDELCVDLDVDDASALHDALGRLLDAAMGLE